MNSSPNRLPWLAFSIALAACSTPRAAADDSARIFTTAVVGIEGRDLDPRDQWLPTAFEEVLSSRLRRVPGIVAMPTVRAWQAVRELHGPTAAKDQTIDWPPVLRSLGIGRQVAGEVRGTPDAVTLRLELRPISIESPPLAADFGPAALFNVLDRATLWLIENNTGAPLADFTRTQVLRPPAVSPSAVQYYAEAVRAARADNARDVVYYLERCGQYDANHAPSQLMIAEIEARTDRKARDGAALRLRRLAEIARRNEDQCLTLDVELAQAGLSLQDRQFAPAFTRLQRAVDLTRQSGDPYGELAALNALGDAHLARAAASAPTSRPAATAPSGPAAAETPDQQDLRAASAIFRDILARLDRLGDSAAEAPVCNKLAMIHDQLGEVDAAYEMHQRTLAAAQRSGARSAQATAWMFLGQWYSKQGRLAEAIDAIRHCLELADTANQPRVRITLAGMLERDKQFDAAIAGYQAAYESLTDSEDLANQLLCLMSLADIHTQLGRKAEAIQATREAIDVAYAMQSPIKAELEKRLHALQQ